MSTLTNNNPNTAGNLTSATEDRALSLLGYGTSAEQTAAACGVSPARISQLLSNPEFAAKVALARYEHLNKHNNTDSKYDDLENKLLDTLETLSPLLMRPMEVLKAISVINNAKRRGAAAPIDTTQTNSVVQLIMPSILMQKFQVNINNQVVVAGDQTLQTIQSNTLLNGRSANPKDIQAAQALQEITSLMPQKDKDSQNGQLSTLSYDVTST